jgi:hypothetical protein
MLKMTNSSINDRIYNSYLETTRDEELQFAQRVAFPDNMQIDAFGRIRTSLPSVVFDNYEIQGKKTLVWNEKLTGAATIAHVANQAACQFSTSAASGDKATRSSKKLSLYTPGTSILLFLTGVMGVGATGSSQRIGLFSDLNGVFFEQKDRAMGVVIRSNTTGSVVDNRIEQADWNIDKFDGTGPSGIDLDFTKTQIFMMDLEWLGVGRVRCGFVHEGKALIAHEFYHNNRLTTVYMKTPILPVTYEVENTAASTALTDFRQICSSVIVEGQETVSKIPRSVSNGVTARATTTTTGIPLISIKLQTAVVGQAMLKPTAETLMSIGNRDHVFEIHYGGTLESASWTNAPGIGMVDIAATHITGSTKLSTVYTASTLRSSLEDLLKNLLWIGGDLDGNGESVSIVARSIGGGGSALAGLDYEEFA